MIVFIVDIEVVYVVYSVICVMIVCLQSELVMFMVQLCELQLLWMGIVFYVFQGCVEQWQGVQLYVEQVFDVIGFFFGVVVLQYVEVDQYFVSLFC